MESNTNTKTQISLFSGLSDEIIEDLTKNLPTIQLSQDESIVLECQQENCLYLIRKGSVRLAGETAHIQAVSADPSILKEGDFCGELGIMSDEVFSAKVVALADTEILEIPQSVFLTKSFSQPKIMANLVQTLCCHSDVTDEEFSEVMNKILNKNRLMAIELTSSKIAHDIKTPLTVISLTTQLIETLFPDSAEFTDSIIKQVKSVEDMVRETLDFVNGTPGSLSLRKVDLNLFMNDLKDTYGASLKGRDISLRIENKCPDQVYFDEERIRRVIVNLIRNSSEAMEKEGEIKIIASLASNWLQISVIDNGSGIPESIVPDLFKPFVTYGKPQGAGLGLAICSKLIKEHSGRLEYIPQHPHGSRFDIRIPQNLH